MSRFEVHAALLEAAWCWRRPSCSSALARFEIHRRAWRRCARAIPPPLCFIEPGVSAPWRKAATRDAHDFAPLAAARVTPLNHPISECVLGRWTLDDLGRPASAAPGGELICEWIWHAIGRVPAPLLGRETPLPASSKIRRKAGSGARTKVRNLIGDRAYDSDPLDDELRRDPKGSLHTGQKEVEPTQSKQALLRGCSMRGHRSRLNNTHAGLL
jgi:hypothetical protein